MIEATVESIRVSLMTQNRVVILKERDGNRLLPIWIGAYEAEAIALQLQGITATRPLPYDLMKAMLEELGGVLDHVVIAELSDQVFYATLVVTVGARTVQLDARPSDALALAVRSDARILVEDRVMEQAELPTREGRGSIDDSTRAEQPTRGQHLTSSPDGPVSPAGEEDLGVFRDFINSLNLEDFGKSSEDPDNDVPF